MHHTPLILCLLCTLSLSALHAQPKSLGATFSYAGTGIVYEHSIDSKSFTEVQLRAETSQFFAQRNALPGLSASFTWNMVFAQLQSRNGNTVSFFAGPGAMIGFSEDWNKKSGFIFGLKGRVGGECTFSRNISISVSISPILGGHLRLEGDILNMLFYQSGLLYGVMPEVGIKYAF